MYYYLLSFRVRNDYPAESKHVDAKEKELVDMWRALQVSLQMVWFKTVICNRDCIVFVLILCFIGQDGGEEETFSRC